MISRFTQTSLLIVALTGLAGAAHAQMGPPNPDLNKDGRVTLAEYKTSQSDSMFGRLDKNKDRQVTREEFKFVETMAKRFGGARGEQVAARIWRQSDGNRDGVIQPAEVDAASTKRFQKGDTDNDGILTKAELTAMRQAAANSD